jgi:predicted  nucleic acid-binding Zn-ribbon protein
MSTTQVAAALFRLQQLDLEQERLTAEQQAVVNSLQGNTQLQKLRAEHTAAQQQLLSALQVQKEAEWAIEDVNRRLQVLEDRLYRGTVSNPKELDSLRQEVQHLQAQQTRKEEQALEAIDAAESLQEIAQRKSEALKQAEQAWQQENAALVTRRDQLQARQQELQQQRAQLTANIDAQFLNHYETLRRRKQGRAVSKVEKNACQWCRVMLTSSELQRVRISSELLHCANCGRILYYDR